MAWTKREAGGNLVTLGDGEGDVRKISGLLMGCPPDRTYTDRRNYHLVQKNGDTLVLAGSASLSRQLSEDDIGKFVKCQFTGWGRSANGKYKAIEVAVWDGDVTPEMRAWPHYVEAQTLRATVSAMTAAAKAQPQAPPAQAPPPRALPDEFEDFDRGPAEDSDELPF
jgi:hypothetical protein